jgi:sulfate adenylyltransferase large subunit
MTAAPVQYFPERLQGVLGERPEQKQLLRFCTAGSVDDGKSTLIGRLLYDSKGVYEDQLASVQKSRINRSGGAIDFSLLTDGLRAEREQGITIDVAYRYFSSPRRSFIIADTPGHEQYTRNMATGASTAHAAVILIDATRGVQVQSRRHAYIASLLGVKHLVAAVNKLDLVGYSAEVFERIAAEFHHFVSGLGDTEVSSIPVSALKGDNVVHRSANMPWYDGPSLLEFLEEIELDDADAAAPLRLPIQYVIRPDQRFRGFAGRLASGSLRAGEEVLLLPSRVSCRVKALVGYGGNRAQASARDVLNIQLDREVDISRGNMMVRPDQLPNISRRVQATLVWMHPAPLRLGAWYLLKHTTQMVRAQVKKLAGRVDVSTLNQVHAETLGMNEIGVVEVEIALPLFFDLYRQNRHTGAFILIDSVTDATVAAGMISADLSANAAGVIANAAHSPLNAVTRQERSKGLGHQPATIWLENRRPLAVLIERRLFERGLLARLILPETYRDFESAMAALHDVCAIVIVAADRPASCPPQGGGKLFDLKNLAVSDDDAANQLLEAVETWATESEVTQ